MHQTIAENKRAESRLWIATARQSSDEGVKRSAAKRARESAREAREMAYITEAADAFEGR